MFNIFTTFINIHYTCDSGITPLSEEKISKIRNKKRGKRALKVQLQKKLSFTGHVLYEESEF